MNTTNRPSATGYHLHNQRFTPETVVVASQTIDHYPRCPNCHQTLLTKAARPWTQWCRTCKRDYNSPD